MSLPATVEACAAALESGAASSRELVAESLARCEAGSDLNALVSFDADGARAAAEAADARRAAGEAGPLTGVPIVVKDIFCVEGGRTTAGSRMLGDWMAPYDAHLVERLRDAGAVIVGKANMDEFAMGSSGENSAFGPTLNPWDRTRVPGGSSSGSAAAVAGGLVPGAFGTDTGGSIRQPAAFCGLTGMKPTYGRISRYGMIAFASSLDQAGPLAWTAGDAALLLGAVAGFDPRDSTSAERPVPDYLAALDESIEGRTVGFAPALMRNLPAAVQQTLEEVRRTLEACGVRFREVTLETALTGVSAYYVIASAEASTNLSRYDGVRFGHRCADPVDLEDLYCRSRAEGFGEEVKRRILTGTYALSVGYYDAYYRTAQRVRRMIRDEFLSAFADVDAILAPVTPSPAFALGENTADPVAMYLQDVFTIPASLAGLPALSMPAGLDGGLPLGAQLIGPHFGEETLFALAGAFQRETDHHRARPEAAA
ncbi:MAG: Asp-tRNA(Asn)/Glu-tRNA(Gln) amidotransferase subunit GatA [Pseudomonadales bacterium]|jgi:aspartyl-tRNA(Asn)/glutamyl-tRNA(Gln) amidotransferase subunit A|nr:Asp-tRNA(Asn)/Glu-tRNA(Gln) amidotransferase subunit GatA [Pseudomonadales bacterium]